MRSVLVFCSAILIAACDSGYIPYVPGPGFRQTIDISLELPDSGSVAAGEWVTMHAVRESGPWVLSDSTTEDPPCERISPITLENEAANKIEWIVDPRDGVAFNTPAAPDFERQMSFTRPGRYRISATSNGCGEPFVSNQVEVVVR